MRAEGNLYADIFGVGIDGRDGYTLTLWTDAREMIKAACKPGIHRLQVDRLGDTSLFDRLSFSRLRVLETREALVEQVD